MLRTLTLLVAVAFLATSLAFTYNKQDDGKKYGYIGAKKCGMCHKKEKDGAQLKKWEEGPHAKAYENLKAADAEAVKNDACLKCHATGAGSDASLNDKKFSIEEGVQCEACHGPGSEYKSMKIMKDHDKSVANGLIVWENDEAIAKMCMDCHSMDAKKAAYADHKDKEFKFEEMYAKVKHNKPE